jgi:hypothetical protein
MAAIHCIHVLIYKILPDSNLRGCYVTTNLFYGAKIITFRAFLWFYVHLLISGYLIGLGGLFHA